MTSQSLCGNLITSKKALLGLGWTFTSLFAVIVLCVSAVMTTKIRNYHSTMADYYSYNNYYNNYNNNNNNNNKNDKDENGYMYILMASLSSSSITFVGIYTAILALLLAIFGSMFVVGFVSPLTGYIAPPFGNTLDGEATKRRLGIFLGSLCLFANLCLVCAVVMGEIQIGGEDERWDERRREEFGNFAIEKISSTLSIMCIFLGVLYFSFAIFLFAFKEEVLSTSTEDNHYEMKGSESHQKTEDVDPML